MAGVERGLGVLLEPPPGHFFARLCAACGQRRGKHRFTDNACPNPHWKTGNGHPQWMYRQRFAERR